MFRVSEYNPHPTEDDILRWLNEGMEEYEFSHEDRMDEGSAPEAAKDKATPIPRNTKPLAQAS